MPDMTTEMGTEILRTAVRYGVYAPDSEDGSLPSDEAVIKDEAARIVQLARNARDKDIVNDGVMDVLFAAQVEPVRLPDGTIKYADVYERRGVEPPAPVNGSGPEQQAPADDQPASEGAPASIEDVFPGYDDKKAREIVKAVVDAASSGDLTAEEWEQIKSYEAANEQRKSILELAPEFKAPEPTPVPDGGVSHRSEQAAGDYASTEAMAGAYDRGDLGTDRARQERLPEPRPYEGDEPVLPIDITAASHQEISRLAMQYHSLHARAIWLVSQEEGRATACESLRDDAQRGAHTRNFSRIRDGLEKPNATAVENARSEAKHLAEDDDVVKMWRNRAVRHQIEARDLKSRAAGYAEAQERLSREQTRREKLAETGASR